MLRAIANAIARMFKAGVGALRWTENLVLSPFRAIFGGGGALPTPDFAPNTTGTELLEEYEANRRAQRELHRFDRDGIESVLKYAAAPSTTRAMIDLSAVRSDARMTLLTMDDYELRALAAAGPAKVRRWLEGNDHGIFGVPTVTRPKMVKTSADPSPPPREMSPQEQMMWRIQARLGKPDHSTAFKLA